MSLKWKEISRLLEEARPMLVGSTVQKIAQLKEVANGDSYLIQGFGEAMGPWKIWTCLQQDQTCWVLAEDWDTESQPEPSTFVMVLRKHLLGKRIESLEQIPGERILLWHFDQGFSLLFELLPKKANILLLENWDAEKRSGKCVQSHRAVSLEAGAIYTLAAMPALINADDARDFGELGSGHFAYHHAVAEKYWNAVQQGGFTSLKRQWRQAWKSQSKKVNTALENSKKDKEESLEAERYQKMGMALVTHLYELGPKVAPKEKSIELDGIIVKLDPMKSYSDNAEACFKKAKKFNRAVGQLDERIHELEKKAALMSAVTELIEKANTEEMLFALEPHFDKEGIAAPEKPLGTEVKKASVAKPYLELQSSDGFTILCGRSQDENRKVTFQAAKGNDLWIHLKGAPGAHVVVKSQKNKTVPLATLLEAAQLCLYHSKIRKGKRAEVDYTYRKFVRAIKGTVAEVTYTGNKVIYLEADPEVLRKLMKGSGL